MVAVKQVHIARLDLLASPGEGCFFWHFKVNTAIGRCRPLDKGKRKERVPCTRIHAPDSYLGQLSEFPQPQLERGFIHIHRCCGKHVMLITALF